MGYFREDEQHRLINLEKEEKIKKVDDLYATTLTVLDIKNHDILAKF